MVLDRGCVGVNKMLVKSYLVISVLYFNSQIC